MKKALMIAAIVLAGSAGAAVAGTSQQHHKQHPGDAATKSMNRGTSANGGVGTGGVTNGSGASDNPAGAGMDHSGRAGTNASPGATKPQAQ